MYHTISVSENSSLASTGRWKKSKHILPTRMADTMTCRKQAPTNIFKSCCQRKCMSVLCNRPLRTSSYKCITVFVDVSLLDILIVWSTRSRLIPLDTSVLVLCYLNSDMYLSRCIARVLRTEKVVCLVKISQFITKSFVTLSPSWLRLPWYLNTNWNDCICTL